MPPDCGDIKTGGTAQQRKMHLHDPVRGRRAEQADFGVIAAIARRIGYERIGKTARAEAAEFPIQLTAVMSAGEQLGGRRAAAVVVGVIDLVDRRAGFRAENRDDPVGKGHGAAVIHQSDVGARARAATGNVGESTVRREQYSGRAKQADNRHRPTEQNTTSAEQLKKHAVDFFQ